MNQQIKERKTNWFLFLGLVVWFCFNLTFLTQFPFMHSDETWLSTLSRDMMVNQSLGVTESVFDLSPRFPHAIKALFHLIQIGAISVFSYSLFSVRLISLIFGLGTLFFFYKLLKKISDSRWLAVLGTLLLGVDVQFLTSSHFARAEAVLLMVFVLALWLVFKHREPHFYKHDVGVGILLGLSIGIHPNSLFVALAIGCVYLWQWRNDEIQFKNLILLVVIVGLFAAGFVGLSYVFDADFISHYLSYGSSLGVEQTLLDKMQGVGPYFNKLFMGVSGTYYTPNIQIQLILFGVVTVINGALAIRKKNTQRTSLLVALCGLLVGFVLVGRFAQPSVIFIFPIGYALLISLVSGSRKLRNALLIILLCLMGVNSIREIRPYLNDDYNDYLNHIETSVPADATVLANLNAEFGFEAGKLFDYRNLAFLDEHELAFADYIEKNEIEYILYPEEMDFIYERRPVWNIVYGNVFPYFDEMQIFLTEECVLVDEFESPYAMRITRFMYSQPWMMKIYQVQIDE